MQHITKEDLQTIGINETEIDALLDHLNEQLEERVGVEIVEALTDESLDTYLDLNENGSDEELARWLLEKIPKLPEIVQDEIDILLGELSESSDSINEAA